jgi:hypothetical protein
MRDMTQAHRFFAAAFAVAVTLGAPEVWAQRNGDWMPKKQGHRLGGILEFWPAQDFFVQSGEFVGQIAVIDELMIDFSLGAGYADYDFVGDHAVFGNPQAGAHWGDKLTDAFSLWAGGTITFPIIIEPDGRRGFAAGLLSVNRALFDIDRFLIEYLTIRPRIGLEAHFADYFFIRSDFGFPLFIDTSGDRADTAEFAVENGNEFEVRAPVGVGGGIRLQLVGFTDDDYGFDDQFQAAIEPYFVYEPFGRTGFFARVGFLLALDEPMGFGFDNNELATVRVTLGGKW